MDNMTEKERIAFEWALNQNHNSVAATYARVLALYIQANAGASLIVAELERRYPNWHKFRDVIEALDIHVANQNATIRGLQSDTDNLRKRLRQEGKLDDDHWQCPYCGELNLNTGDPCYHCQSRATG
jgi:hypothetical protein